MKGRQEEIGRKVAKNGLNGRREGERYGKKGWMVGQ